MNIIKFNIEELKNRLDGFSCYILGRSYDLEENGLSKNNDLALKYYYEGINKGNPLCEYSIGISLVLGDTLDKDEEKGNELLREAYPKIVKLIDDETIPYEERLYAKFVTGAYNYYGLGDIEQSPKKAFELIKDCADEGILAAIYDLGANFYYNGVGTDKDLDKAEYYLSIAKEAGLPRAIKKYEEYGFGKEN